MIYSLSIGVTIGFSILSAVVDAEHINKKEYINKHRSRWLLRLCFFISIGLAEWQYFFASAFLFTALFDQLLNKFRDLPLWYLGTVARWDVFFSKRKWLYILVKVICLSLGLFLFIY